ncbi:MAG TPA: bifunctional nuclease family protein [Actinobacteria bacterium]|nr:bifunctional nuclease family protein [Actinomycetota bacterium]
MLEMTVHAVNLDALTNQPVIILKDMLAHRFLPIWIGQFEATAILMELQNIKPPRPLTHDLLHSFLKKLGTSVEKIAITDLKDGTFYASILILKNGRSLEIDARPSDAIALAVRTNSPIFVAEKVLQKASVVVSEAGEEEEIQKFKMFLEDIDPEDFKG